MAVPQLRFKEFKDEWLKVDIQALVDEKIIDKPMDGNHGEIHPTSADYVDDGIPFVMATDVIDGKVHLDKSKKIKKSQADGLRKGFSVGGDILLTHKATIGNVAKVPELKTPYVMLTPQVTYYRVLNKEKLIPDFIKSAFEAPIFQNELLALCTGATRLYIGISEQRKLPFSYPSKEEQTKIASFLCAVDEKISQLTQKHELLSQYKQGMMQKLFSQQIRFKADDGSDFGEWEEIILSDVSDVRDGTHDSPKYVKQGYAFITSKNLKNGKLDFSDINYISKQDYENISKRSKVDVGDIIFGMIGTIGNPVLLMQDNFAIKNVALIKQKDELLNIFLIHYLNSRLFDQQVRLLNAGNTQKFLALGQIRSLKILKPCLAEQNKIANFLSSIDQKIEVVAQQIEQAKQWKKGLLQQMFV